MPREYSLKDTRNFGIIGLAVGLLVLLGAGCGKTSVTQNVPVVQAPSSTADLRQPEEMTATETCFANTSTSPAMFPEKGIADTMRAERAQGATGTDVAADAIAAKLQEQYRAGWNVDRFCVTTATGGQVIYFSLYAFTDAAKKLKPVQTIPEGQPQTTLMRLGYAGHGPGYSEVDSLSLDSSGEGPLSIATVSGDGWKYSISFTPDQNVIKQLEIQQEK